MLFLILVLLFVIWLLCNHIVQLKHSAEKDYYEHSWKISQLQAEKTTLADAKEQTDTQIAELTKALQSLKAELDETNRKLDFYKNIEEDSGNLNSSDNKPLPAAQAEEVTNQINLLDSEQAYACSEMENSNANFFITGKAGTGKSFLLDTFKNTTEKSHIVLAPTGIAALNVSGATLHSTFGYYNLVHLPIDQINEDTIRLKSEKKLLLQDISTLIIDEISMVRADTFEKIDRILKALNHSTAPFGGKQILLFGDLFQLPPVVKAEEHKYLYDTFGGIYFFCSNAFKAGNFRFLELSINHRQKDDAVFFSLLNRIRDGSVSDADMDILNKRATGDPSVYDRFTTLLPTKAEVERLNQHHLNQLDSPSFSYHAKIILDKYPDKTHHLESIFPILKTLQLKKGALVMMVANDSDHRWVNGTLGIINKLTHNSIFVSIDKRTYEVHPLSFTEQEIHYENRKISYEDVLEVSQFPLVPAYAMTIHKSQGQTYKNIVCDIERCFANGQAYVALSRCASLDGLHLKAPVNRASIHVDHTVLEFYQTHISQVI